MKIMFIRHGDPNYELDTLTEKGWREAALLADRLEQIKVTKYYCSPLGRARDTASLTLKRVGREAIVYDWMKEFSIPVIDPIQGKRGFPWDFYPSYWTAQEKLYDKDSWFDADIMLTGPVKAECQIVFAGLDQLLSEYGYIREGRFYRTKSGNRDTIVIFCHLGAAFLMMSHLLGLAAPVLWQGFYLAPTSVTTLCTEERMKGEAYFRCKTLGDTYHLEAGGEPVSPRGFHEEVYE